MNQLVRMSHLFPAETVQEPSPELRVPFAQSGAFVCKFIIGEPNDRAICCGAPVQDGKSWCAFHRRIVFEPARPGRLR
ncbi:GcrA family cell cycle regulator [Methylobacterium sp. ID0610]|uniref:GcrA family cell cycle regulator n=1 Tax=Methylobacterium carpenticola TaxID=3344827 RepID=UPI00368B3C6F